MWSVINFNWICFNIFKFKLHVKTLFFRKKFKGTWHQITWQLKGYLAKKWNAIWIKFEFLNELPLYIQLYIQLVNILVYGIYSNWWYRKVLFTLFIIKGYVIIFSSLKQHHLVLNNIFFCSHHVFLNKNKFAVVNYE